MSICAKGWLRVAHTWCFLLLAVFAAEAGWPHAARAETLNEALTSAYKVNPRLDAARATLRATDEEVPRAISGYRPTVTGNADTSFEKTTTKPDSTSAARTIRVVITCNWSNLFSRLPNGECRVGGRGDGSLRAGDVAIGRAIGPA